MASVSSIGFRLMQNRSGLLTFKYVFLNHIIYYFVNLYSYVEEFIMFIDYAMIRCSMFLSL